MNETGTVLDKLARILFKSLGAILALPGKHRRAVGRTGPAAPLCGNAGRH